MGEARYQDRRRQQQQLGARRRVVDRHYRAIALCRCLATRLPRLCPACRLYEPEPRPARYLLRRPNAGGPGVVQRFAAIYEASSCADRRRPLWRVQRTALGKLYLSDPEKYHLRQRLRAAALWRRSDDRRWRDLGRSEV